jgi:N-sulfoglucosamine sulfohydrolase
MPYAPAGQYLAYLWKIPAAPAWEQYYREGKADEITGRFFKPRVSEEFYDTVEDFDNVHNLIATPEHQARIAEMRKAMRRMQLELHDSGLIPETMRERRAAEHGVTIYEMVRDPKLYPLESYLDAADLALARDRKNLPAFVDGMSDSDACIRYWSVVGLLLLDEGAAPAAETLKSALDDEADEVKMLAAWTLVKIGHREEGLAALRDMLFGGTPLKRELHNVLDWMDDDAVGLVKEYLQSHPEQAKNILGKIAEDYAIKVAK